MLTPWCVMAETPLYQGHVADRREVLVPPANHVPDELLAARDADANLNPAPFGAPVSEGLKQRSRGPDGPPPIFGRCQARDEDRLDLVARDLAEKGPVG